MGIKESVIKESEIKESAIKESEIIQRTTMSEYDKLN